MSDEPHRHGRTGLSPVEAIMTGLLGLAVALTLGFAVGGLLGSLAH